MTEQRAKPIGELNGPWAKLFKTTQLLIPVFTICIVPWATWTTKQIISMNNRIAIVEEWRKAAPFDHEALCVKIKSEIANEMGDKIFARFDTLIAEISALKMGVVRLETQVAVLQRQLEKKSETVGQRYVIPPVQSTIYLTNSDVRMIGTCAPPPAELVLLNERQNNALGHR